MKKIPILLAGILLFAACSNKQTEVADEMIGLKSILWFQNSAEAEALYLQGYNIASQIVLSGDFSEYTLPPAITLDIDETILDNSPFSVNMMQGSYPYSDEKWAEWCNRREAIPLPGALKFTQLADSLGIEIFYVTNRAASLKDATLENLKTCNFPNADTAHLFLKTTSSSKDNRRAVIRKNYHIVLLLGDNLGDFDGIFDDRADNFGKENVRQFQTEFGTRFIIFPNPMYGRWERGAFPEGLPDAKTILGTLRGYDEISSRPHPSP